MLLNKFLNLWWCIVLKYEIPISNATKRRGNLYHCDSKLANTIFVSFLGVNWKFA